MCQGQVYSSEDRLDCSLHFFLYREVCRCSICSCNDRSGESNDMILTFGGQKVERVVVSGDSASTRLYNEV